MSKASAPSDDFHPPTNGPPSYNQALSEGAMPHPPPPGPAEYKPPYQPAYGGYGPPPGAGPAGYPPQQYGAPPQQYGAPPQQYGAPPQQYGPQQQQYGQYGAPPGLPAGVQPVAATIVQTVPYTGPNSTHMVCPHCHAEIDTSVKTSPSTMAWVSGLLIALFGCWMGCCLIPCCMDECMDKEHSCPNCQAFLGRYRR